MKFGGTSVGSAEMIDRTTDLIISEKDKKIVVVSAIGKVTDQLLDIVNKVVDLPTKTVETEVNLFYKEFLDFHINIAEDMISVEKVRTDSIKRISNLIEELRITLLGVGYLGDLSNKSLDYVLSFGERLSVLLLEGALNSKGCTAKSLTGYEAGIVTNSNFGCARPIYAVMGSTVKSSILPLINENIVPVVTGFVAADSNARITTMGRGGSDYTASLLGRFLDVDEVQIWTDVDGIMTTDPRIVSSARLIPKLSYVEAMDLAYFGAGVIHSKMIEPAMTADISVRIKNTFNPGCPGTLIVHEQEKVESVIKAVTIAKDVSILNLKGVGMAESTNIAGKIFNLLGENEITIPMISGSSESNLSFVIRDSDCPDAIDFINENFVGNGIRSLEIIEDVCIITVVGAGMAGAKGIAAKIFQTMSDNDVNIIMIAQGSSEVNVSSVVKASDGKKVLEALHNEFIDYER